MWGLRLQSARLIVNYLMQSDVARTSSAAGRRKHVHPLYWGGAMVGRFIGSYLLRIVSPGKLLASAAVAVLALLLTSASSSGSVSAYSLLAIGLCNSIMFPTIFTLSIEGLGPKAASGSGIICMAIVGGAVVPLIMGHAADLIGLKHALFVPAICYAGIVGYGIYARRPASDSARA